MAMLDREWPRDPATETVNRCKFEIGADVKIWKGADVVIDTKASSATRGYLIPAGTITDPSSDATGQLARGRARATMDNTGGANGAKSVEVDLLRPVYLSWHENSGDNPCVKADRGSLGYFEDDHTVGNVSTDFSQAGRIWDIDTAAGTVAIERLA